LTSLFSFPLKIVDMQDTEEGKMSSVYHDLFKFSELKIQESQLYYRNPKFGKTGIWFKFGIPELQQV